eukprot:jgi/Bigna1/71118/fgenesh1_pg.14_\
MKCPEISTYDMEFRNCAKLNSSSQWSPRCPASVGKIATPVKRPFEEGGGQEHGQDESSKKRQRTDGATQLDKGEQGTKDDHMAVKREEERGKQTDEDVKDTKAKIESIEGYVDDDAAAEMTGVKEEDNRNPAVKNRDNVEESSSSPGKDGDYFVPTSCIYGVNSGGKRDWTIEVEREFKVGCRTGLVYDERMCEHFPLADDDHPESPMRIRRIYELLVERKLADRCVRVPSREATKEEIQSVHSEAHRQTVWAFGKLEEEPLEALERVYDSIYLNKKSGEAARLSAGSTVEMVTRVVNGDLKNGVAVVRPPGHHAERHACKGFCLFNNVAIAAKIAVEKLGVKRVLVLDWDIHHGNGTQHMFEDDRRVLYFSVHRYDHGMFYPGSTDGGPRRVGQKDGKGFNINVGWNGGNMGDGDYIGMFHQLLLPVAYEFAPELILISAGFDSARGDPLGGCDITPTGYAHMTHLLMGLAQGKIVMVLEGGYNLNSISQSFAACTSVLLGDPPKMLRRVFPTKRATRAVQDTKRHHSSYWTCCSTSDYYHFGGTMGAQQLMQSFQSIDDDEDEDEDDEDYQEGGDEGGGEEEEGEEKKEKNEREGDTSTMPQGSSNNNINLREHIEDQQLQLTGDEDEGREGGVVGLAVDVSAAAVGERKSEDDGREHEEGEEDDLNDTIDDDDDEDEDDEDYHPMEDGSK